MAINDIVQAETVFTPTNAAPPSVPEEFRDSPPPSVGDVMDAADESTDRNVTGGLSDAASFKAERDAAVGDYTTGQMQKHEREMEQFRNAERFEAGHVPKPWNADEEKAKYTTGPFEKFGSFAMVFAQIASAFSRQPAISALNASAAVLNAINTGDEKAYKDAYTAWKDNTDLAIKRFDMQHKLFSDTQTLFDTDITKWRTQSLINAQKYGDEKARIMLQNGMDPEYMQAQADRLKIRDAMIESRKHVEAYELGRKTQEASFSEIDEALGTKGMENKKFEELSPEDRKHFAASLEAKKLAQAMINGQPGDPKYAVAHGVVEFIKREKRLPDDREWNNIQQQANAHLYGGQGRPLSTSQMEGVQIQQRTQQLVDEGTPEIDARAQALKENSERKARERTAVGESDVKDLAKGIEGGTLPPNLVGFYRQKAPVEAQLKRDGFDLAKATMQWDAAHRQISTLNGPQMTRFAGLAQSVINTIDEVRDLSQKMKLGGVPAINKLELQAYIQTQGNTPSGQLAVRYITAVNTMKEEFANLAQGGYAPTESVWALANSQVNENYGVKALDASIDEIQRLIRYRVNAIPNISTLGPTGPNRYTGRPDKSPGEDPLGIR